jgi:DNA mismatch endonuclease (patch repair protein)
MTDVLTPEQRKRNMSAIRSKDTKPELAVRSLLHRLGYRYRLHVRKLPGAPDIVFPSRRKVIFVHGCYWHLHDCVAGRVTPRTNAEFWQKKRTDNVTRDTRNEATLNSEGWEILIIWECEIKSGIDLTGSLCRFLEKPELL